MDLIVSPTAVALNTQSGAPKMALTPGQLIDALVLQLIDATTARLSVGDKIIDVKTEVPLAPGAHVKLAARGHGEDIRWMIVGTGSSAAAPRGLETKLSSPQTSPRAEGPVTEVTIGTNAPAGEADFAESTQITPDRAQTSVRIPPTARNAPTNPSSAVEFATATRSAAARQSGLAPVFAELNALVASTEIPATVRLIASQILGTPAKLDQGSGENLRQAVAKSGLFLEARLAADGQSAALAPFGDLKAGLLTLRQALQSWLEPLPTLLPDAPKGEIKGDTRSDTASALAQFQADVKVPPPPYRGAPTAGQQPMAASPLAQTAPSDIARALLNHTDGALARQVLMQVASLPEMANAGLSHQDGSGAHWNLEIPFFTPQGVAFAHFEITRDGRNASAPEAPPAPWRANFSLDFEPMGPVHAQIALTGKRAAVRIWAERKTTATALRAGVADLTGALRAAELDSGDVVVRDGAPPRPLTPNPGRFLDRAS